MSQTAKRLGLSDLCDELLATFAAQRPIRSGSLIISVFGDAIAPHGGSAWLGSIIEALEPFGVNERLARTSVSRLSKQGWLVAERIGRRSYYRLTETGLRRFDAASRRIYCEPTRKVADSWCLVLLDSIAATERDEVRKELGWLGFAALSSSVLAHPTNDLDEVKTCLASLDGGSNAIVFAAQPRSSTDDALRAQVRDAWQLDELGSRYEAFLARFRPAYLAARQRLTISNQQAFCLRLLLIHEYRRILLRDPFLPTDLLPDLWQGTAAYQLCRNFYLALNGAAETYLAENLENAYGPLPPADRDFQQRFRRAGE